MNSGLTSNNPTHYTTRPLRLNNGGHCNCLYAFIISISVVALLSATVAVVNVLHFFDNMLTHTKTWPKAVFGKMC